MYKDKNTVINVPMSFELKEKLHEASHDARMSMCQFVRESIEAYIFVLNGSKQGK